MWLLVTPVMIIIGLGTFVGTFELAKRIFRKTNVWITIASVVCALLLFGVVIQCLNPMLFQTPWFRDSMAWH